MLNKKLKTARAIAMDALNRFDSKNDYAATILNELLSETNQRQRATDIVYGTLRNYLAIDTVLEKIGECTIKRISPKLRNIIRVAIYELIYCPQTAKYSILNEAVEITKTIAGQKQAGFVNAILRKIDRAIKNRQTPLEKANTQATIVQNLSSGCEFNELFLPPATTNPAAHLSEVFSLPSWLVADWLDEFGFEKTRQICFGSNRKPAIYVRPNTLKITAEELAEKFTQEKIETVSTGSPSNQILPNESMLLVKSPKAIVNLPGFAGGLFSVQDITASKPVKILNPKPNWKILDLCAAPGTKTTQLAEYTNDAAEIVATDIDSERLKKVSENIKRLKIKSVTFSDYE
ncbi:MAG: methyltransferase domain-containing protein, partial [Planctomycetes bacterium]|nr:methyltransferase domain-containing protein [Planctomycetota bacterium]